MSDDQQHGELGEIDSANCVALLHTQRVGRLVAISEGKPQVVPLNYIVVGDSIVVRTAADSMASSLLGTEAAFEVDALDYERRRGWSVVVRGVLADVADDGSLDELDRERLTTWAPGDKECWLRIAMGEVTGRWVAASEDADADHGDAGYL